MCRYVCTMNQQNTYHNRVYLVRTTHIYVCMHICTYCVSALLTCSGTVSELSGEGASKEILFNFEQFVLANPEAGSLRS